MQNADLTRALHSISGIARTLGCTVLGDDARQLERKDTVLMVGDRALVRLTVSMAQLRQDLAAISTSLRNVGSTKQMEQVE